MPTGTPKAEVEIDEALIRELLEAQHPDLARLQINHLDTGWDNAIYRLGDDLLVRLPRREIAAQLLLNEQKWLPFLAPHLPLPIPAHTRVGAAQDAYPWAWSIVPWIDGKSANLDPPNADQGKPLAEFLRALHQPAPENAPINGVRGVPLQVRAEATEERLERLRKSTNEITKEIDELWREALAAPQFDAVDVWVHGDPHARNVLVKDGKLASFIDWGDITSGDPANDLSAIWMLLGDKHVRAEALEIYAPSDVLLARAKGWAVFFGAVLLDTGLVDFPAHIPMGKATLRRLIADF
jgi:aminoglycoside phosphotransferase (APT) family kinase protein